MKVMCDIDGVIANPNDQVRQYLINGGWNWAEYFSHTLEIPPIKPVIKIVRRLSSRGGFIIFCTGRPSYDECNTSAFITRYFHHRTWVLHSRDSEDTRPTVEFKLEIARFYKPDIVFEDEERTAKTLSDNGYTVMQVLGYRIDGHDHDRIPFIDKE